MVFTHGRANCLKRVAHEMFYASEMKNEIASKLISVGEVKTGDKFIVVKAVIIGPANTPYQNGVFNLEIIMSNKYPTKPPYIKFINKIYHPNVNSKGYISLSKIINWRISCKLITLLFDIRELMISPNLYGNVVMTIAKEYIMHSTLFNEKASEWTKLYALEQT